MPGFAKPAAARLLEGGNEFRRATGGGMWTMSEGAGLTSRDILKRALVPNDLTLMTGQISWTGGLLGRAISHSSTTSADRVTPATAVATGITFTLLAGITVNNVRSNGSYSTIFANAANSAGFWLKSNGTVEQLDYLVGADKLSAAGLSAGVHYDVAVVVLGGNLTYYINGVPDANTYSGITTQSLVNMLSDGGSEFLDGRLTYQHLLIGIALTQTALYKIRSDPFWMFRKRIYPWMKAGAGTTPVSANYSVPVEFLQGISAGRSLAVEFLQGISGAGTIPVEILQGIAAPGTACAEWVSGLQQGASLPVEFLRTIQMTGTTPVEWLAGLQAAGILPIEWQGVGAGPDAIWILDATGGVLVLDDGGRVWVLDSV